MLTNMMELFLFFLFLATPYFLFPLRDQHLDVGSELTWVCEAVAVPRATYAWYRNGVPLITDVQNNITVSQKNLCNKTTLK